MVKNINLSGSSSPGSLIAYNNKLYFSADDGTNGRELWVSDGTADGTMMLKNIHSSDESYPGKFIVHNGKLYFSADDGTNGKELWISDGTADGTVMLKDIYEGVNGSNPFSVQ